MPRKKKTSSAVKATAELEDSYQLFRPLADRLRESICEQISSMIAETGLTLGVPLESRVKAWDSIKEKIGRNGLTIGSVNELTDLVGARVIFLFRNELDTFQELVRQTFDVVSEEDTAERLEESQFGYQSRHMIVKLPRQWLDLPSLKGLDNLHVELQIRTVAQHIWAAASHKLQYKREQSVPVPVRRAIYRVSALLETIDLEFLRVLEERQAYVDLESGAGEPDAVLNVDNLRQILDSLLPSENKDYEEAYDKLLINLNDFGINTAGRLRSTINEYLSAALNADKKEVTARRNENDYYGTTRERTDRGVFYTHVGLTRQIMKEKFGHGPVNDSIKKLR